MLFNGKIPSHWPTKAHFDCGQLSSRRDRPSAPQSELRQFKRRQSELRQFESECRQFKRQSDSIQFRADAKLFWSNWFGEFFVPSLPSCRMFSERGSWPRRIRKGAWNDFLTIFETRFLIFYWFLIYWLFFVVKLFFLIDFWFISVSRRKLLHCRPNDRRRRWNSVLETYPISARWSHKADPYGSDPSDLSPLSEKIGRNFDFWWKKWKKW